MSTETVYLDDIMNVVGARDATKVVTTTRDAAGRVVAERWAQVVGRSIPSAETLYFDDELNEVAVASATRALYVRRSATGDVVERLWLLVSRPSP